MILENCEGLVIHSGIIKEVVEDQNEHSTYLDVRKGSHALFQDNVGYVYAMNLSPKG